MHAGVWQESTLPSSEPTLQAKCRGTWSRPSLPRNQSPLPALTTSAYERARVKARRVSTQPMRRSMWLGMGVWRSFGGGWKALLRSGDVRGPKEPDPDTPPLVRVLPSTGDICQYPFRRNHLRRSGTSQYSAHADMRNCVFSELEEWFNVTAVTGDSPIQR